MYIYACTVYYIYILSDSKVKVANPQPSFTDGVLICLIGHRNGSGGCHGVLCDCHTPTYTKQWQDRCHSAVHWHKTMTRQVLYSHLHTDIKQWQGRCYTHTCTDIKQWQGRCYTHASTHTQNNDRAGVIPTPAERKLTEQVPLTAVHSNKTMTGQVLYSHLQKENLQDRCHSQLYTATKKGRNKCYTHTCRQTQNSDKAGIRLTPGEEKKRKEKKKIFF